MAEPAGDPGDEAAPSSCPPDQPPPPSSSSSSSAQGQDSAGSSAASSSSCEPRLDSPPGMDPEPAPPASHPLAPEPPPPPPAPPPAAPPQPPQAGHLNIPLLLEELRVLQQRQLRQMQMTEEICRQVLLLGSLGQPAPSAPAPEPAPGATLQPKPPLPLFSVKSEPGRAPGSPEAAKPAFFQLYHPFPPGARPPKAEPLLAPAFPAAGLLAAQCLGAARGLEQAAAAAAAAGLLRPKNGAEAGPEEKPGGRHRCRFCAKAFGSDSALQIHLRSHTGERPYKCNVCGNRFTTRGNLKVHFHRHREKYPHVQMNPHPVPEHLDYALAGPGPAEEGPPPPAAAAAAAERKGLSATQGLTLLAGAGAQPVFNKLLLLKAAEGRGRADENTPPGRGAEGARAPLGRLPGWALLANHFKAAGGSFPVPCVLEPLGGAAPSETSKLQQLVEKIDRRGGSPGPGPAPAAAPSPPPPAAAPSPGANQCVICLRVLSCPRALRLHYGQHGGERPFKCKVCGRAFSTRGNLRAHVVGHRARPAARAQNSCPICQKKFTNAVSLQQHVRLHLGGQIPNGALLPQPPAAPPLQEGPQGQPEGPALPAREEEEEEEEPSEEEEEEEEEEEGSEEDSLDSGAEKALGGSEGASSPEGEAPAPAGKPEGEGAAEPGSRSPSPAAAAGEGAASAPQAEGGGEGAGEAGAGAEDAPRASQAKESAAGGGGKEEPPEGVALRKPAQHQAPPPGGPAWPGPAARPRGRWPGPEAPAGPAKLQEFLARDVPAQLVGPLSFWNQYTAFIAGGGLPAKTCWGPPAAAAAAAPSSAAAAPPALFGPAGAPAPAEAREKPAGGPPAAGEAAPESHGKGEK